MLRAANIEPCSVPAPKKWFFFSFFVEAIAIVVLWAQRLGPKSSINLLFDDVLGTQWEIPRIVSRYDGLGLPIDLWLHHVFLANNITHRPNFPFWVPSRTLIHKDNVLFPFSLFLTLIFPTPNTITSLPFYTLLLMEFSWWQNLPHECGTHRFKGQTDHLGLEHCSCLSNRLSEVGLSLLTLRGFLSNLCLIPIRCLDVSSSLGLLMSSAKVMDLNVGSSPTLPILMPSIFSRMGLLISSAQLWNGPMTFPITTTIFLL